MAAMRQQDSGEDSSEMLLYALRQEINEDHFMTMDNEPHEVDEDKTAEWLRQMLDVKLRVWCGYPTYTDYVLIGETDYPPFVPVEQTEESENTGYLICIFIHPESVDVRPRCCNDAGGFAPERACAAAWDAHA